MDKGLIETDIDEEERKVISYIRHIKETYFYISNPQKIQGNIYNLLSIQISSINNVQTSRLLSFLIYLTLPFAILSSFESIYTGMIEWNNPWPFYQVIKYFKLLYSKYCSFLMYMARLHANFSFCVWKYIGCSLILQLLVVAICRTFLVVKFLW